MILKWLSNLIGDSNDKKLVQIKPLLAVINSKEEEYRQLSDEQLRHKTLEFKDLLSQGKTLDDLLPDAFAAVREVSVRTTGLRHFDVQILGGIVLYQAKIAEMKTGEGKTLAATLPAYLKALTGKGVHIVTVNDYLARRDRDWMEPIYQFLGLTVGVIQNGMSFEERRVAYSCDITYGTNNEFGFDYLRDNMAFAIDQCVQRELNYAIIDEVDSILVDEARTPLIISGMVEDSVDSYNNANRIAKKLQKIEDFTIDEKTKNAVLTEKGTEKVEKLLNVEYLFDIKNMGIAHQIIQSLKAWHLFKRDIDYVVKDGEILIVDEFTGRLMVGRRYSDGLHQGIEAKENVSVREESQTLATITLQNYFRLYKQIAGMTGTAKTEENEFWKIYKLEVMVVPTHKPMIRKDHNDIVYKTTAEKFKAVINEITELHKIGRPTLVGTISIENSEILSDLLKRRGIPHHVLNAKQHEREAEIISRAGQKGAVTIATNMAGRGTDIVLGEGIADLGGLHIIGTERHESRRIDNQLRGRSGRQGDMGSSRFYVSLEDELMRLFGSDRIKAMMDRLGIEADIPIENPLISRSIENAQKKVEQYYFNIRKQVLEFDDVMNKQRDTIYKLRRRILERKDLKQKIFEMIEQVIAGYCNLFVPAKENAEDWDLAGFKTALSELIPIDIQGLDSFNKREELQASLIQTIKEAYEEREKELTPTHMRELECMVMLRVLDTKWIEQLHNMDTLREGIGLRAYGHRDPLVEYKMEGYHMFQEMMHAAREEIIGLIFKAQIVKAGEEADEIIPKRKAVTYGGPAKESTEPTQRKGNKVGRNDPCPCGSGKKYKKCCLLKEKSAEGGQGG
ncbi:MAG: preprotein translocase subunit SecA [Candidatus Margulisbacteria bacterium]|nr:preprotein translocase subunit SecA [Candidatus Margulisiibacteriota bacterium]MBU1022538.1 preprotein translocase subunit SecA [Candidatus Margulisiibacteriota bacterium]MBU1728824.1 preprotein translocase subunit SecA [Candidatus Margulisiibacteriota bacterium]MBU1955790.1 preprotein translocase subunit SecA [Candidatus Margulisiibacteriota bacterium]